MNATDHDRLVRLEAELVRRIVDGGDDPVQAAKDTGADAALAQSIYMMPHFSEDRA